MQVCELRLEAVRRACRPVVRFALSMTAVIVGAGVASPTPGVVTHAPVASATGSPLSPRQQRALSTALAFFRAYDARNINGIFAVLEPKVRYADCNYRTHHIVILDRRSTLTRWLHARFREHDRYVISSLDVGDTPGHIAVGGTPLRRSDVLDPLEKRGVIPPSMSGILKVIVTEHDLLSTVELSQPDVCSAGILPPGAQPDAEQALAQSFLDAYNRHDVTGVLAVLDDGVAYQDCDYTHHALVSLTGKVAVEAWLRARFTEGDQITEPRMLFDSFLSELPDNVLTVVVNAVRNNRTVAAPSSVMLRIIPNFDVNQIRDWQVWQGCPTA